MSDSVRPSRSKNGSRTSSKKSGGVTPVAAVMPRSVSLNTLSSNLSVESLKPRISRLETLEAKMANIEVSLSSINGDQQQHQQQQAAPPPRKRMSQNRMVTTPTNNNIINSNNKQEASQLQLQDINLANDNISKLMKEVESIRQELSDKDALIDNLRKQQNSKQGLSGDKDCEVIDDEMKRKQEQLKTLQQEIDDKQAVIKTIRFAMDNLEVNDSLDERIHQAELEFQQEREELALLNLQQEYMILKSALEEQVSEKIKLAKFRNATFFSLLGVNRCATLVAVEVPYNPQSPNFVIAALQNGHGLFVQWARDHSSLKKGDRLIEVNGHLLLNGTRDNLIQVLSKTSVTVALQITVLRNVAQPTARWMNACELHGLKDEIATVVNKLETKTKENKNLYGVIDKLKGENGKFQRDNLKLNHRIMFLEDQVGDLQRSWEDLRCTLNQVDLSNSMGNLSCFNDGRKSNPATSKRVIKIHNDDDDDFRSLPINCHHPSNGGKSIQKSKSTEAVVASSKLNLFPKQNHNHGGTTSITVNQSNSTTTTNAISDDHSRKLETCNVVRNRSIVKSTSMASYSPLKDSCPPQGKSPLHVYEAPNNSINIVVNNRDDRGINPAKSKSTSSVPTYLRTENDDDDEDYAEDDAKPPAVPHLDRYDSCNSLNNNCAASSPEATNVHVNVSGTLVKSQSYGHHLDRASSNPTTEANNGHILQVHVPFVTRPEDNSDETSTTRGRTALKRSVSASRSPGQLNLSRSQSTPTADKLLLVDPQQPKNGFRLHRFHQQYQQFQNRTDSNIRPSQIAFHLKVNNNKIALNDYESDHEQWC